jgi:hypothetical protein
VLQGSFTVSTTDQGSSSAVAGTAYTVTLTSGSDYAATPADETASFDWP